jgi:hypothetical protein
MYERSVVCNNKNVQEVKTSLLTPGNFQRSSMAIRRKRHARLISKKSYLYDFTSDGVRSHAPQAKAILEVERSRAIREA